MNDGPIVKITRENLLQGTVAKMVAERNDGQTILASEDELLASRRGIVPDDADCSDIWVFGYGSLIFNPVMDFVDRVRTRIFGYHRRFCLWTRLGRGTPDFPGLVLALDRGGSCTGVAFRLNPETAISELDLLWRREMISLSYRACWMPIKTPHGPKRAIGFVSRPDRENYAKPMTLSDEADVIANAHGFIGPCCEYLFDTVSALHAEGFKDPHLEKLSALVKKRLASAKAVS